MVVKSSMKSSDTAFRDPQVLRSAYLPMSAWEDLPDQRPEARPTCFCSAIGSNDNDVPMAWSRRSGERIGRSLRLPGVGVVKHDQAAPSKQGDPKRRTQLASPGHVLFDPHHAG